MQIKTKARISHQKQYRLFMAPFILGTLILVVLPTLVTIGVAFTEFNSVGTLKFAGGRNFITMFQSAYVRIGLKNSLIFLVLAVPIRVIGALFLALLLRDDQRGFGIFRSAIYLPTVIPGVAYALVWLWIFNPIYGPLNVILTVLGLPALDWLTDPNLARLAMVILISFQLGEGFVIMLAGLQTIPRSYYESGKVDGASQLQMFRFITLPLLLPWLILLTFRDIAVSLQATFTASYVITYGGPYYATTFLPLLVYEIAFDFLDFGMAAAVMLFAYIFLAMLIWGILNLVSVRQGGEHG